MARMALIADRQRERAADSLRRHFLCGRLTADEFADRVDLALRARTDRDLRAALDDLPRPWEPAELLPVARAAGRVAQRVALFCVLASLWTVVSVLLLVAFVVAMAAGASTAGELAVFAVWVAITYAVWRKWSRETDRAHLSEARHPGLPWR